MSELKLPQLEIPCPDCPTDEERRANSTEWRKWRDEEQRGFEMFEAARRERGNVNPWDPDAWQRTDEYEALVARQPVELAAVGCVECDYTGLALTDAGREMLDFLARRFGG